MTTNSQFAGLAAPNISMRQAEIARFSGLSRAEAAQAVGDLRAAPPERRRELLDWMIELAEGGVELEFTAIFHHCLRDDDDGVRARAARGLWDSEDRAMVRPLVAALLDDPSARVRAEAASTLGKFAHMAARGRLIRRDGERISAALLTVIARDGEEMETRRRAIEAVAPFDSDEARRVIEEAYSDGDVRLAQSAIYAMGRSQDPRWLPIALEETRNPDAAIRYEATAACGALGSPDIAPRLAEMLDDDDSMVRAAATRALGAVGGDFAKLSLARAVASGDAETVEAAEEALAEIQFAEDPLGFRLDA